MVSLNEQLATLVQNYTACDVCPVSKKLNMLLLVETLF